MHTPIHCISSPVWNEGIEKTKKGWIVKSLIVAALAAYLVAPAPVASSYVPYKSITEIQQEKESKLENVILKSYDVSTSDAKRIVESTYKWSKEFRIEPSLILGVIATESGFQKHAISGVGAFGLMQVLPKWHTDKIKKAKEVVGSPEVFDVDTNIYLGAWILKDCMKSQKNVSNALKCYNGSLGNDTNYHKKVISNKKEFDRYI